MALAHFGAPAAAARGVDGLDDFHRQIARHGRRCGLAGVQHEELEGVEQVVIAAPAIGEPVAEHRELRGGQVSRTAPIHGEHALIDQRAQQVGDARSWCAAPRDDRARGQGAARTSSSNNEIVRTTNRAPSDISATPT